MIASVLCPGPSLPQTFDAARPCGLIVGVNRAVTAYRCDAWAALDDRVLIEYWQERRGEPLIVTRQPSVVKLAEHLRDVPPPHKTVESMLAIYKASWSIWSMTVGVMYAIVSGADLVRVHGADFNGILDFDGHKYPWRYDTPEQTRTPAKWQQQQDALIQIADYAKAVGSRVEHIHGQH